MTSELPEHAVDSEVEKTVALPITPGARPHAGATASQTFDGIICFGGLDWWYHNRGHYDIQMMRHLSSQVPTLYVNSIGMRIPRASEGRMFLKRVARKLKSFARGFQRIGPNFAVYSPIAIPGQVCQGLRSRFLAAQVTHAATRMNITSPLIWIAIPTAFEPAERMKSRGIIYQRTDRYEAFPGVDGDYIRSLDRRLKAKADISVFCSSLLFDQEAAECRRAAFIDHGVDYEMFSAAGDGLHTPADVAGLCSPRVGFVGAIDAHTFDPELFLEVAASLPECSFVMVGACSLPQGWCTLSNVHLLGQRPYEQVADYMAACDVLIMPWNKSEWINACNPVKLKEYLAVGRPVVTTPFGQLARFTSNVVQATSAAEFANAIRLVLASPPNSKSVREDIERETWTTKSQQLLQELREIQISPTTERHRPSLDKSRRELSAGDIT